MWGRTAPLVELTVILMLFMACSILLCLFQGETGDKWLGRTIETKYPKSSWQNGKKKKKKGGGFQFETEWVKIIIGAVFWGIEIFFSPPLSFLSAGPPQKCSAGGEGLVAAGSGAEGPGQNTIFSPASAWLLPGSFRSCPSLPPGVSLALRCWPPGAASALHPSPSSRASYPGRAMAVRVRSVLMFLRWLGVWFSSSEVSDKTHPPHFLSVGIWLFECLSEANKWEVPWDSVSHCWNLLPCENSACSKFSRKDSLVPRRESCYWSDLY